MDWTAERAREAEATLRKWRAMTDRVEATEVSEQVLVALADDLNTAGAVAELHKLAAAEDRGTLKASAGLMGLLHEALGDWASSVEFDFKDLEATLSETRAKALQSKDFAEVDRLKSLLIDAGVEVRMSKEGVELLAGPGFDATKLEALT